MDGNITGLSTGFLELDNKTYGMQAGDLIIVAARPSMGKTTFAMNLVESVLFNCNLLLLFILWKCQQIQSQCVWFHLMGRCIKDICVQVNWRRRMVKSNWYNSTITGKTSLYWWFFCTTPTEVRARARRIAKMHDGKIGCIMVDYLQLMKVPVWVITV